MLVAHFRRLLGDDTTTLVAEDEEEMDAFLLGRRALSLWTPMSPPQLLENMICTTFDHRRNP